MNEKRVVTALEALAQKHRLQLFRLLAATGAEGLSAGVIAERLGIAPSSLSFHLTRLTQAGLLSQQRVGRQLFYAAEFEAMRGLVTYLSDHCSGRAAPGKAR